MLKERGKFKVQDLRFILSDEEKNKIEILRRANVDGLGLVIYLTNRNFFLDYSCLETSQLLKAPGKVVNGEKKGLVNFMSHVEVYSDWNS